MNIKLSELIKKEREKKEYSQRELAKRIKVDNATISRIENGTIKKPSIDVLMKLSNELEIDINILFDLSGYISQDIFKFANYKHRSYTKENLLNYVSEEKLQKCLSINENLEYIDIKKVLKNYKYGKLTENETIALITFCETIELYDENKITYISENGEVDIEY